MTRAFANIAFTEQVRAIQSRMGSREAYRQSAEIGELEIAILGPEELAFIEERDSFYQATVGQNGWPYVQHRGGPPGFLKVLDERTLGYADFSGNRQYISVGNLTGDERICLFLMDYTQQRRLKIWGRARIVEDDDEPTLLARIESPDFRARVERGVVIRIEAFDWNCPKYITPRFTQAEARAMLAVNAAAQSVEVGTEIADAPIGTGPIPLVIDAMRQLTPGIRAYEFKHRDGGKLPAAEPGSHLVVPVRLTSGAIVMRQYSLVDRPGCDDAYEIAVLREDSGEGGSASIHSGWHLGTEIRVGEPVCQFSLHNDERPAILVAGGIGITPILSMAYALRERNARFEIHYTAKSPQDMAYRRNLIADFPGLHHLYFSRAQDHRRMNLISVMNAAKPDTLVYVCGPTQLIAETIEAARNRGLADNSIRYESFQ